MDNYDGIMWKIVCSSNYECQWKAICYTTATLYTAASRLHCTYIHLRLKNKIEENCKTFIKSKIN